MLLGEILHEDVIKIGMEAENKYEAIEELVDVLVAAHEAPLALRNHLIEVVTEREYSMSTGMQHNVGLPHGASNRVSEIIGALGIAPGGIPFDSVDGQPAKLILLLVLPQANFQGHVRTLAGIAHLLDNAGLREQLIAAADIDTVLELIESEEDKEEFASFRGRS